jgi:hypothetical protein
MIFLESNTGRFFQRPQKNQFGPWVAVLVLAHIALITSDGYAGDTGYWVSWINQLQKNGLRGLDANYPPVFIYWLWLVGKLHAWFSINTGPTLLLKALVNTPVVWAHAGILFLVRHALARYRHVDSYSADTHATSTCTSLRNKALLGLTALNPAFLLNGPVWGQVDLIYATLVVLALYWAITGQALIWVLPLLTIALLTKFQTIFVLPVLFASLLHQPYRKVLWGVPLAFIVLIVLLLPYWWTDNLLKMIDETYIRASSYYPFATMNAHNLWHVLGLNMQTYDYQLFKFPGAIQNSWTLLTPKKVGIFLFGVISLTMFVRSWRKSAPETHWRNAIVMGLCFFTLLPAMHERYLLAAVVVTTVAAAITPMWRHLVVVTIVATLNMWFVLHSIGGNVPWMLSLFTTGYLATWFIPVSWLQRLKQLLLPIPTIGWVGIALSAWCLLLYRFVRPLIPEADWIYVTQSHIVQAHQSWGKLGMNASANGRSLQVAGQLYGYGLGTHAESSILIRAPSNVSHFSGTVGIDDETSGGLVDFQVDLAGRLVWQSGAMRQSDGTKSFEIEVRPNQHITLSVNSMGNTDNDHADWLNLRFKPATSPGD